MRGVWLSLDFDYFVPEDPNWDWGHKESNLFRFLLWPLRISGLLAAGIDPREYAARRKVSPQPHSFWETLSRLGYQVTRRTNICVADSHAFAAQFFLTMYDHRPVELLHFDAHHDLGYHSKGVIAGLEEGHVMCDDWHLALLHHCEKVRSKTVYPEWRGLSEWSATFDRSNWRRAFSPVLKRTSAMTWEPGRLWQPEDVHVDDVFICRSSAWVPPYYDEQFIKLVAELSRRCGAPVMTPFIEREGCNPLEPRDFSWDNVERSAVGMRAMQDGTFRTLALPVSQALSARVEQEVELEVPQGEDAA